LPGCDPMVGDFLVESERSDLEGKNLRLIRGRFVAFLAREWTVSLPCILLWF